jgi:uncharacterized damage-inducible protein DinB
MATAQTEQTWGGLLVKRWEQSSRKIAELAEAFPPEKLESRPTDDVRTAGEVLRHVAFWNRYVADSLRGKEADESANELPRESYPTKASLLEELKRGAEEVSTLLREPQNPLDASAAELVMSFVEHTSEHYGQLAAYARWNKIVPPASRT